MFILLLLGSLLTGTVVAALIGARRIFTLALGGTLGAEGGYLAVRLIVTRRVADLLPPRTHTLIAFTTPNSPVRNAVSGIIMTALVLSLSVLAAYLVQRSLVITRRWRSSTTRGAAI